ncbi:unnamed protein product [Rotaria magnacalcarata]|uniref:ubiquitinyl hydrolase 1 n=1 Tax=Rotaria magnacalcarata TaxID=392030 RepID=A0A816WZL0_9BILA|nr:unnamed protein product [Rotaria magnacalcarata]CAF1324188.1 unnamed protein product [Rotaria magnacalcarata]CAF2006870.1 unnamed protein product [Rotaria magnacalcarata]CAF2140573.1 unnamed protein product [Rotaria magnacalcarata]CAF2154105.1 unnamed protein product [Rotaria magnacalcarata]
MSNEKVKLYHEKQRLQLCGLHSLNSLFQKKVFSKETLDSFVNKHDKSRFWNEYSTFLTGNYDLRILMDALESKGYVLRAIDSSECFEAFSYKNCLGLLLNIAVERPFISSIPIVCSFVKSGRHWLTIKSVDEEKYYNFDSKFSRPELIGYESDLIAYLNKLDRVQTYIYIVIEESIAAKFEQE